MTNENMVNNRAVTAIFLAYKYSKFLIETYMVIACNIVIVGEGCK